MFLLAVGVEGAGERDDVPRYAYAEAGERYYEREGIRDEYEEGISISRSGRLLHRLPLPQWFYLHRNIVVIFGWAICFIGVQRLRLFCRHDGRFSLDSADIGEWVEGEGMASSRKAWKDL